ncbi:MAG: hypothetical protein U9Q33_07540 [Campylobacterota bacterium]|nr:hypothetical protein [Campylobacterota bacterium]
MQTIHLKVDDNFYDEIVKSGIDIQSELKKMIKKAIYKKEQKIASDINSALQDVKNNKSRAVEELLNEL